MAKSSSPQERLVVVLTEFKEIFCGWTSDTSNAHVSLRNARQAIYYSAETQGLLGLATNGPARGSKIGPAANIECRRIVNIIECQPAAAEAWEKAKWA